MKKFFKLFISFVLAFTFFGCASKPMDDAAFLENLEKGLSDRWLYADSTLNNVDIYDVKEYKNGLKEVIQKELSAIGDLSAYTFKDKDLEKLAKEYYDALNLTKEGIQYYSPEEVFVSFYIDDSKFANTYHLGMYQRCIILDKLVNEYDFMKDNPKKSTLDEVLVDLDDAKKFIAKHDYEIYLKDNVKLVYDEGQSDEYSSYYSTVIENNTDVEFSSVNITADALDKDGVIVEQMWGSTQNFKPGSKAKLEFWISTEKKFDSIEVSDFDIYIE